MLYKVLTRPLIPATIGNGIRAVSLRVMSSSTRSDTVLVEETPTKAVLTMNRPRVLNAVNMEMITKTYENLKRLENTKWLIIVKGAGDRSFSVGGDVGAMLEYGPQKAKTFLRNVYTMNYLIKNYKTPYVALMDGLTMGGGVGLSVHGKYRVATERTLLAMPETAIGLFPDVGSSYFLSRLEGKLGLFLGMTGHRLKAEDTVHAGIATHFCESSKLDRLESELLKCEDPENIADIVNTLTSKPSKEFSLGPYIDKINKCFAGNTVEDIFQNLERDGSEWALNTLTTLKKMSPLSLKITHRQLRLGENLSLAEGLKMEFRLASRCLDKSDFQEGVRALIVEKDKNPKWNPSTVNAVPDKLVAQFFAKLPDNEELKLERS